MDYFVADGAKEIDLGLMEFKAGVKSQVDGFSIKKVGPSQWEWDEGMTILELNTHLLQGALKESKFLDENGKKIECQHRGTTISNGWLVNLEFGFKGTVPERGRIVMTVYDDMKRRRLDFKLTDVSLLGRPLEQSADKE